MITRTARIALLFALSLVALVPGRGSASDAQLGYRVYVKYGFCNFTRNTFIEFELYQRPEASTGPAGVNALRYRVKTKDSTCTRDVIKDDRPLFLPDERGGVPVGFVSPDMTVAYLDGWSSVGQIHLTWQGCVTTIAAGCLTMRDGVLLDRDAKILAGSYVCRSPSSCVVPPRTQDDGVNPAHLLLEYAVVP